MGIKAVHAAAFVGDRRVCLPADAQIQGKVWTDLPVVLKIPGQVPVIPVELLGLAP